MPPEDAATADVLILEFIASNRRIPNGMYISLVASLAPPSGFAGTSQHLHQALVLRALDGALQTGGLGPRCSRSLLLLRRARGVLADPDAAACFPHQIAVADDGEDDEASAAAAVADLRRLLDLEWANLPPCTLKSAADSIAGDGSHQTLPAADQTKRTNQWDDADDDQPYMGSGKRKLPSFERESHPSTWAIRKKWSEIEEKTLLEGVKKYGKGCWKDIKLAYPDVFEERSTVDLKDKFRNLERRGRHHESA